MPTVFPAVFPAVSGARTARRPQVAVTATGEPDGRAAADRVFALLEEGIRDLRVRHLPVVDMVITCAERAPIGAVTLILPPTAVLSGATADPSAGSRAGRRAALIAPCEPGETTVAAVLECLTRLLDRRISRAGIPVLLLDEPDSADATAAVGVTIEAAVDAAVNAAAVEAADAALGGLLGTVPDRTVLLITRWEPTPGADAVLAAGIDEVRTLG